MDDRQCEDIGTELRPGVRRGPSTDERHLCGRDSGAAQRVHRVCEPEGHSFKYRTDDRVAPVIRTEPGEDARCLRSVRRALAR